MNQLITVLERATNGLSTSTTISIYPISKVIGIYPTLTNAMGPNNYNKSEGREGRTVSGPILLITEIYFHQSKPTFYDTIFTGLFSAKRRQKICTNSMNILCVFIWTLNTQTLTKFTKFCRFFLLFRLLIDILRYFTNFVMHSFLYVSSILRWILPIPSIRVRTTIKITSAKCH